MSAYFQKWKGNLDGTEIFEGLSLLTELDFNRVTEIHEFAVEKLGNFVESKIDIDEIADEMALIADIVHSFLIKWQSKHTPPSDRWIEVFHECKNRACEIKIPNISRLVELVFCIPGTSCEVERIFSIINDTWNKDTENTLHATLEALVDVKYNFINVDCLQFYKRALEDKSLLAKVKSSEKYLNNT